MIEQEKRSNSERALFAILIIISVGLLGIVLWALQAPSAQFISMTAVGAMVAGASILIGGLLGFLFGIPRTLQQEVSTDVTPADGDQSKPEGQPINYRANTNLEQISDWLTKILVGVGLTQITVIPQKLQQISASVAVGLGGLPGSQVFATAEILFFTICGFLFGYLWTRLFLPGAFRQADLGALASRVEQNMKNVEQVDMKLKELERQRELDSLALGMVQRQLNPSIDIPAPDPKELDKVIHDASRPAKIQIFNQAQIMRSENWRTQKAKMKLTIPIFQSLVKDDIPSVFHRNHGQLGFALKDQEPPDWAAAEIELTAAINSRGAWESNGWLFYEFNRAYCWIMLDEDFKQDRASNAESRERILADLRAVFTTDLRELILKDSVVKTWMRLNEITRKNLE